MLRWYKTFSTTDWCRCSSAKWEHHTYSNILLHSQNKQVL